ncbi:MAG: DUF3800 domain-containing protein [Steroidobacteraceae bacterium]
MFYIDDSSEGGEHAFCAISVPAGAWRETFAAIKAWRQQLKQTDGVYMRKELHATEFVAGRGKVSDRIVPKGRRCQIFRDSLSLLSTMPQLSLFSVVLRRQDWAFERLLNRINRTMLAQNTQAILISDEGKEGDYTKLVRKMSVHNPIPSQFGVWKGTGSETRNIPIERIIEDPIFRPSDRSYLLQMADFCAFSLIRYVRGVRQGKEKYGLHTAFPLLEPICFKEANPKHPLGIIGK